jgi:hypothetical protein
MRTHPVSTSRLMPWMSLREEIPFSPAGQVTGNVFRGIMWDTEARFCLLLSWHQDENGFGASWPPGSPLAFTAGGEP